MVGLGTPTPTFKLTVDGDICATGTIGPCSDGRFKKNVEPIGNALEAVSRLRGVRFDWRRDEYPEKHFNNKRQVGFIAQEIMQTLPEVVSRGSDGYYSVDYGRVTPVLVEAIKQLKSENELLQARVDHLTTLVETMLAHNSNTKPESKLADAR